MLTVALVTLIFARSVDQTLFYRLNFAYEAYVWYLATVILPVAFVVISWPVVWYKMYFTGAWSGPGALAAPLTFVCGRAQTTSRRKCAASRSASL